jgi:type VI secretion system protein ImpA
LAPLGDAASFVGDVRSLVLVDRGTLGRVTIRDALLASGKLSATAGTSVALVSELEMALRMDPAAAASITASLSSARESLTSILSVLNSKAGSASVPDLHLLQDALDAAATISQSAPPEGGSAGIDSRSTSGGGLGEIRSREDAIRHLENVCEFFQRTEPANPAPLLIRRAQRLITKSFVEIIEDLAPGSVGEVMNIAGLEKK